MAKTLNSGRANFGYSPPLPSTNTIRYPALSGTLTYTGSTQSPTWSGYDPEKMELTGVTSATDAGTYIAVFTPVGDYEWIDGTQDPYGINWVIGKATPTLEISVDSLSLDINNPAKSFTIVSYNGDGVLSAECSDTSIADADLFGDTVTVIAIDSGDAEIIVTASEGTNYLSVNAICTISVLLVNSVLDYNSWETISKVSKNGDGANYWQIGDTKSIHVEGTVGSIGLDNDFYVYILGFSHNKSLEGDGITFGCFRYQQTSGAIVTNPPTIGLIDASYNAVSSTGVLLFNLNHWGSNSSPYNTNFGGWEGCDARYDILGSTDVPPDGYGATPIDGRKGSDPTETCAAEPVPNTLMAALPEDLRKVMVSLTVYTDSTGNASKLSNHVTASIDYLPLLAEYEIHGARTYANEYEQNYQEQYEYYSNGNSKIRYDYTDINTAITWWTRSPSSSSSFSFCSVETDGSPISGGGSAATGSGGSRFSLGIAPIFRV